VIQCDDRGAAASTMAVRSLPSGPVPHSSDELGEDSLIRCNGDRFPESGAMRAILASVAILESSRLSPAREAIRLGNGSHTIIRVDESRNGRSCNSSDE